MFQNKKLTAEIERLRKDIRTIELKLSKHEFQLRKKPLFTDRVHDCIIVDISTTDERFPFRINDLQCYDYQYIYTVFNEKTKTIHSDILESVLIYYQENKEQSILNA